MRAVDVVRVRRDPRRVASSVWLPWVVGATLLVSLATVALVAGGRVEQGIRVPTAVLDGQQAVTATAAQGVRRSLNEGVDDLAVLGAVLSRLHVTRTSQLRMQLLGLSDLHDRYRSLYVVDHRGSLVTQIGSAAHPAVLPAVVTEPGMAPPRNVAGEAVIAQYAPLAGPDGAGWVLAAEYDPAFLGFALEGTLPAVTWVVDIDGRALGATGDFEPFQRLDGPVLQRAAVRAGHGLGRLLTGQGADARTPAAGSAPATRAGARRRTPHKERNLLMLYLYVVYVVYVVMLASLLLAGLVEKLRHEAQLSRIPHRVHVNGIRGKSSTTRLCAGALRGGGLSVVAKTTGSAARFLWADGTEEPVYRKFGIANVTEQIGIVRRAAAENPDVLVMECMAVQPALQEVTQDKIVQGTIGVIGNVRADHLEEMGPTLDDVARSLSRTMPRNGVCVTAEVDRLGVLQDEARKRKCRLVGVDPCEVTDADMAGFKHFAFKENVALALAVAAELGISRDKALAGMHEAAPDPGVLTVEEYQLEGRLLRFANVFAANDPTSTVMNVEQLLASGAISRPIFTVINCRPDRVERNAQMGAIVPQLLAEKLFLIGHPVRSAQEAVPRSWNGPVIDLGGHQRRPESIVRELVNHAEDEASVVAVGNIHGQGELLLKHLGSLGRNR